MRQLLEIAPTLCGWAAFHVWHMKVLRYAVFKDRRPTLMPARWSRLENDPIVSMRARALKAEQYSLGFHRTIEQNSTYPILTCMRDPHGEGRATGAENSRPVVLIRTLAITGRANPELLVHLWST